MTDISYIVSCYNSEEYLDGLFSNLLQQHYDNFEIIVVDSASTDFSRQLTKDWSARDKRIRLIDQGVRTPYGVSWLDGWKEARGRVIANSNTDDRSYHWRSLQVMNSHRARQLTRSVKPHAFYYGGYETRVDGKTTAKGVPPAYSVEDMTQFFRCGIHVHWDAAMVAVTDWPTMYRAAYTLKSAFDYWLVLYFMSKGAEGVPIPSCFSIYNQRSDSLEQIDKERNTFESLVAIETFFPESIAIQNLHTKTKEDSPEFYDRYLEFCDMVKPKL